MKTMTRGGRMNINNLHQQLTAVFRYAGCLLHWVILLSFKSK